MDQAEQQRRKAMREKTLAAIDRLALNPAPVAAIMQTDGTDTEQLIKALAESPVLTARVIGVANSAGSSAVHRMDTIERCVRHLGARQTRAIALTMAMQLMVQDIEIDEELLSSLWVASTTKAMNAKLVAETVSPEFAEAAYTMGLLQDIALPVLLALDPGFFRDKLLSGNGKSSWSDMERARFGIDHARLGAILLQRWKAPAEIVEQVQRHHVDLNDDDMAWVMEMPSRFAGLLPHLNEPPTKQQRQTIAAAHARFLSNRFETVESMMKAVYGRVKEMGQAAGGQVKADPAFIERVVQAAAEDTFAIAAQVTRLDRQLSEQIEKTASVQQDALSDTLTGLLNRRGFESFARQMLAHAAKAGLAAACLVIDLDDFKPINDKFGHAAGDAVLKAAADLLSSNVSAGDLVARMGGDEFVVLVVGDNQCDTHGLAQRLHAICNGRRINIGDGNTATLGMSIGGVFIKHVMRETTPDELISAADQVMYQTKRNGKHGLTFQPIKHRAA